MSLHTWVLVYVACGLLGLSGGYALALASLKRPVDCAALQADLAPPFGWPLCPWEGP